MARDLRPLVHRRLRLLNFLFLCNLGVILTAVGLLTGSALLLSSQAVAAMIICLVWCIDAGGRLLFGFFPLGATAYMWDPQYPLFTRLLSLYHVGFGRSFGPAPLHLAVLFVVLAVVVYGLTDRVLRASLPRA